MNIKEDMMSLLDKAFEEALKEIVPGILSLTEAELAQVLRVQLYESDFIGKATAAQVIAIMGAKVAIINSRKFEPGDQIIHIPTHANGDPDHPDCEFGIITRMVEDGTAAYCRYWKKGEEGKVFRTQANAEITPLESLVKCTKVEPQAAVSALLKIYEDFGASVTGDDPHGLLGKVLFIKDQAARVMASHESEDAYFVVDTSAPWEVALFGGLEAKRLAELTADMVDYVASEVEPNMSQDFDDYLAKIHRQMDLYFNIHRFNRRHWNLVSAIEFYINFSDEVMLWQLK